MAAVCLVIAKPEPERPGRRLVDAKFPQLLSASQIFSLVEKFGAVGALA